MATKAIAQPRKSNIPVTFLSCLGIITLLIVALAIDGGLFFLVSAACVLGLSLYAIWRMIASLAGDIEENRSGKETIAMRKRRQIISERDTALKVYQELEFDRQLGRISDKDYQMLSGPVKRAVLDAKKKAEAEQKGYRESIESEIARRLKAKKISPAKSLQKNDAEVVQKDKLPKSTTKKKTTAKKKAKEQIPSENNLPKNTSQKSTEVFEEVQEKSSAKILETTEKPETPKPSIEIHLPDVKENVATIDCPSCEKTIDKTSLFCKHCGHDFSEKTAVKEESKTSTIDCPGCKKTIEKDSRFCKHCGHNFAPKDKEKESEIATIECSSCKEIIDKTSRFCKHCGQNFHEE